MSRIQQMMCFTPIVCMTAFSGQHIDFILYASKPHAAKILVRTLFRSAIPQCPSTSLNRGDAQQAAEIYLCVCIFCCCWFFGPVDAREACFGPCVVAGARAAVYRQGQAHWHAVADSFMPPGASGRVLTHCICNVGMQTCTSFGSALDPSASAILVDANPADHLPRFAEFDFQ